MNVIEKQGLAYLYLALISALFSGADNQEICTRTLDLVFVVDGSNSLGIEHFESIKRTIARATQVLKFGPSEVRVGVVLYSSEVTAIVDLQTDKNTFELAVQSFKYPDEATYTDLGIAKATEILTRNRRPDVPIAMMIVTDGTSSNQEETRFQALYAASRGIDIWAVGVSNLANMTELRLITRNAAQAFEISTFDLFPDRLLNLTNRVCIHISSPLPTFTPPTKAPETKVTPESTTTTSITTSTVKPSPTSGENIPYTDVCKNSPSIGGVGYTLYPGDCTKVLQCYYNPGTSKTLIVTRQCPYGQFWDQSCLKCVDSWLVDCPYDKCRPNTCSGGMLTNESYAMEGVCGGYWSCREGRAYPQCCPPCYKYIAGHGCNFNDTCVDKCGASVECEDGIGVCEKIPVWDDMSKYNVVTDSMGLQTNTCQRADLSIADCRCQLKNMEIFMQDTMKVCLPYYTSNTMQCLVGTIPIKRLSNTGPLTLHFGINTQTPQFDITTSPIGDTCLNGSRIRIWADQAGLHASVGGPASVWSTATVFFKNVIGHMEIFITMYQGKLSLGVKKDTFHLISTVKVKSSRLCTDCAHNLTITTANRDCPITKIDLYDCKAQQMNIYV